MSRWVAFVCTFVITAVITTPLLAYQPGENVTFKALTPFNSKSNSSWGPLLKDIVNHEAPGDHNPYNDKVTLAHETSHGIHSYIRNYMNDTGQKANGFYVLQNRAVLIREPGMRKRHVAPFVPQSLRGYLFSTYITGQTAWDDTPLYIFDEWVSYTNGGDIGVNQVEQNLWNDGWRDAVAGQIEFSVYAIATAMAVEQHDPEYFENNVQFREFLAWNLKRSMESYKIGSQMETFKWDKQDKYYENLKYSPDAENLRQFTRDLFGADWVYLTLGF